MTTATEPITRSGMTSQLSPSTVATLPGAQAKLNTLVSRLESTASKAKDAAAQIRADRGLSTSGVQERLVELSQSSADSLIGAVREQVVHTATALKSNRASVLLDTPLSLANLAGEKNIHGELVPRKLDELQLGQVQRAQEHALTLARDSKRQAQLQAFVDTAAEDELRLLALDQLATHERAEVDRKLTGKTLDEVRREFRRSSAPTKTLANIEALREVGVRLTANLGAAWGLIQRTVRIESAVASRQIAALQAIVTDASGD